MKRRAGRRASAVAMVAGLALVVGCTKGQTLRVGTSIVVKAALKDNHIDYRGAIVCTGDKVPINCAGTTTDGRPIAATLSAESSGSCILVVTAGGAQVARDTGAKCK